MIGKLWGLVPLWARLAAVAVAVTALVGALAHLHREIDMAGYNRCDAEYKKAAAEAEGKAQGNVIRVEKKYAPIKKRIIHAEAGEANHAGPVVTMAIDGLRNPRSDSK